MLEILFTIALVFIVLALVMVLLSALGLFSLIDMLDQLATRVGLSRPSAEGRTVGQEHVGRVTRAFALDPDAAVGVGTVFVNGETWAAECAPDLVERLRVGTRVRVVYEENLRVRVLGRSGPLAERPEGPAVH